MRDEKIIAVDGMYHIILIAGISGVVCGVG